MKNIPRVLHCVRSVNTLRTIDLARQIERQQRRDFSNKHLSTTKISNEDTKRNQRRQR